MFIENDPFKIVFKAFQSLYPGKNAIVYFQDTDKWKAYGVTFFGNATPVIYIDPDFSIRKATKTLIHELAHVAVGYQAAHNHIFEEAKNKITKKYFELLDSKQS